MQNLFIHYKRLPALSYDRSKFILDRCENEPQNPTKSRTQIIRYVCKTAPVTNVEYTKTELNGLLEQSRFFLDPKPTRYPVETIGESIETKTVVNFNSISARVI